MTIKTNSDKSKKMPATVATENNGKSLAEMPAMVLPRDIGTDYTYKREIVWFNALGFLAIHLAALYGYFLCLRAHVLTVFWMFFVATVSGVGVTLGAHRLYSHKAFKATFPLRLAVIVLQTIAGQNCLYIWVRDHRQHHKYSDTDADPHNANRGFFFAHVGWLMSRKHPLVIKKGDSIDMSDLEADALVMFQKTFYKPLYTIFALAGPIAIPVYLWQETYWNSLFISYFARYILLLNFTWLINSATHLYGTKPYDKFMNPVENALVSFLALGEGWHNYHHAFPYDYRAAEFGVRYSVTTFLIDILAYCGLAYDMRTTKPEVVMSRTVKKGDGSHPTFGKQNNNNNNQNNDNNNVPTMQNILNSYDHHEDEDLAQLKKRSITSQG